MMLQKGVNIRPLILADCLGNLHRRGIEAQVIRSDDVVGRALCF